MTPATGILRISIADDHRMFVEALQLILEQSPSVEVVSVASNGHDFLRDVRQHRPEIALMDIGMDGPGYQQLAAEVCDPAGPTRGIAVTMHLDRDLADRVIAAGFSGYVVKDAAVAELLEAIHAAAEGRVFVSRSVRALGRSAATDQTSLTPRELACLRFVAEGQGNREIAKRLSLSERTVKFHLENVFRKLEVRSRGEAVAVARRMKLI